MKWQNLIHGRCPKCDTRLEPIKDKAVLYECQGDDCHFIISQSKYLKILGDENHAMRLHLTAEELAIIESTYQV